MEKMFDRIELLYFDACPSWKVALENLEASLADLGLEGDINLIRVETNAQARQYQFVGSPTIRVNGLDIFPVDHQDFALSCRMYATPAGYNGFPTREMLMQRFARLLE